MKLIFITIKLLKHRFMLSKSLCTMFSFYLALIWVSTAGRILNGDIWVDYANAGSMTEISFSFMLQNPLDQYDYIKASLPFPLHSSLIPAYPATEGLSLPYGLQVTYQSVDSSSNILPTVMTCQALTETIDSSNYFIRFYAADRKTLVPIANNQWFHLKFKINDRTPLQYQKSNSILQIQLATVSSVWSNAMVYDDNLAFGYFQLASAPSEGITLQTTPYNYGPAGQYLLTQKSYNLYMDVTMSVPTYQFSQKLKLIFFINEEDSELKENFKFDGTCSSVAKTNSPKIAILNASTYTCAVDVVNNQMMVVLNPEALAIQTSYRFTVGIINPSIVMKDVNISVKAVKQVSGVILSYGKDIAALTTNQIYVTYQQIFVGWGLRPDALLPFDARVFRGSAATPTYMPYNSLSTKFRISQTTSSAVELKVQLNIPSESAAYVLENGYTHNLPSFQNKEVRCVVEYADDTIKRKIVCTGVGSLIADTVYEIGWKMYFPYDNYQSSIDCTQFGLLTIYTARTITDKDNVFILGRGNQFLEFLKASDDHYVIGRNSSYIAYMKTFANLNLVVLSSDFQDFLKIPEQIIVTNRPNSFADKKFNDVYVVGQNLAFMTYLQLFNDIYVAYQLKSNSDIIKGYDQTPLVATSMPKNTLTIKTSNSKDWTDFVANTDPLISSTQTLGGLSASSSLKAIATTPQSLIFSLKAQYTDVSSVDSADLTINDKWGMLIMMSPKIKLNNPTVTLVESSPSLDATAETIDTLTAYNKYTLITLKASTPASVQANFPTSPTKKNFGLQPFLIEEFCSFSADQNNYDIMIATIDGIDGPLNTITYNGFFLINGFTLTPAASALNSIHTSFVAYSPPTPMDGSKVPTLLRVRGQISGSTNFHTLNIFFDKLTPFFENYHNRDIFCKSTDGSPYCKFYKGAEVAIATQIQNYMTFSRIQISLTAPGTLFDILIPITHETSKQNIYIHVGYTEKDPVSGRIYNRYVQQRYDDNVVGGYTTAGIYGPDLTGHTLGSTITPMTLLSNQGSINLNNIGVDNQIGSAFLYFSEWDYFKGGSTSWPNGDCHMLNYLLYQTNYEQYLLGTPFTFAYKDMKGVVCFCDTGTSTSGSSLSFTNGYLPSKWGVKLPGYGAYSLNTGQLKYMNINNQQITTFITAVTGTIKSPTMGPLLAASVGQWVIPLPVALTDNVEIIMTGSSSNLPFTSSTGTCCINVNNKKTPIGCVYTSSLTELDYILTIKQRDLLPAGTELQIMHYGLTTNASYSTINYKIQVFTLVNTNSPTALDLIFKQENIPFKYGPVDDTTYIGKSQLTIASYKQETNNKAAVTSFNFSFGLQSKGLYVTNRIRINLGQYEVDNSVSSISPRCKIYEYSTDGSPNFSHDWAAIDFSRGFDELEFWPQKNLISSNLTYTVKCQNFLATSTSSPVGLTGKVVNTSADLTGDLSTTAAVGLSTLVVLPKSNQVSASKKFTIPSTTMQISFTITSPGVTSDSILYIGFPSYYANGLGSDIKCYTSSEIFCKVDKGRQLMIRYLGTYAEGTQFIVQVVGVSQPVNYNSGTFYFVIDNDDNRNTVLSSGTFIDSVSTSVLDTQNFPAFQILSFTQSSAYLREEGIKLQMQFYIPTTLGSVTVGQYLFLVFPPNFGEVLRFVEPNCILNIRGNSLKNYISSCSVKGMRLKMPFLDDLVLGSVYYLSIDGIINPFNPSSNVYKYALQISSTSGESIVARSYSPHANFEMPIFIVNPIRQSLNYYTVANGLITQLITTVNLQSQQVFISPSSTLSSSSYSRNVYLEPFNNLYSDPSTIDLLSGQNPFPIRMSGLTSGINYVYFQKNGDGNYYSSLPPLMLRINKNYFTPVSFLETQFNLPVAAVNSNYSVAVNLPFSLYPITEVALQVTLSSTSQGVSLRQSPTIIYFYPSKTSALIRLYINDATLWTVGRTTNLVITPLNTSTYAGPATIPLTATNAVASAPVSTLVLQSTTLKTALFSITCSEHGRFVYHISKIYAYNTTACSLTQEQIAFWIEQSSIDGLRVDETYYDCQDYLGVANIVTPGTVQNLNLEDIQTSTTYLLSGYCISQIGTKSQLQSQQFSTQSNGGYVSKMDFFFAEPLSAAQKIKLVCALALKFEINYKKVSTYDGYHCSELLNSRRLLTDERRILAALTYPYRVEVYYGINVQLNSDNSPSTINAESISQTGIQNQLANVVGLPALVSMSVSAGSYVGANQLGGSHYVDIGPNYIYVEGLTMANEGIIYIIIGQESLWPRAPVISEIKKGSGPNGLPPVFYKVLPYRTDQPQSGYVSYTGMPNEKLKMYILASNDNPFDDAQFGAIHEYEIEAQIPTWERSLLILSSFVVLFLLM